MIDNINWDIIIYQTDDGLTKVDVRVENETVWLSQQQMAELFDTTKQNISLHIKKDFWGRRVIRKFNCQGILDSSKRRKQKSWKKS